MTPSTDGTADSDSEDVKRKKKAEADKAEVDLAKARRDASTDPDLEVERKKKKTAMEKEIADNEAAASTARRKSFAELVPDLSESKGSLKADSADDPIAGSALSYASLGSAVRNVVMNVVNQILPPADESDDSGNGDREVPRIRILVTPDIELVNSDAAYSEVMTGAAQLCSMTDSLLPDEKAKRVADFCRERLPVPSRFDVDELAVTRLLSDTPISGGGDSGNGGGDLARLVTPPLDAIGAVVAAVPQVLALLSSNRSITTKAPSPDQVAAAAAVAGELSGWAAVEHVWHDSFRLLPSGDVVDNQINQLKARREALEVYAETEGVDSGLVAKTKSLGTAIDEFLTALSAVPAEGKRSPLMQAKARALLHSRPNGPREVTHVLFVQAATGSSAQLVQDRPLWFEDKFSVFATSSVTYLLLECEGNRILAGGTESGAASIGGEIGSSFDFGRMSVGSFGD